MSQIAYNCRPSQRRVRTLRAVWRKSHSPPDHIVYFFIPLPSINPHLCHAYP